MVLFRGINMKQLSLLLAGCSWDACDIKEPHKWISLQGTVFGTMAPSIWVKRTQLGHRKVEPQKYHLFGGDSSFISQSASLPSLMLHGTGGTQPSCVEIQNCNPSSKNHICGSSLGHWDHMWLGMASGEVGHSGKNMGSGVKFESPDHFLVLMWTGAKCFSFPSLSFRSVKWG